LAQSGLFLRLSGRPIATTIDSLRQIRALILGLLGGPLSIVGERLLPRLRWLSDPVGLLPGRLVGGLFGVVMIEPPGVS
jgi:ammonia channel protein AmtB